MVRGSKLPDAVMRMDWEVICTTDKFKHFKYHVVTSSMLHPRSLWNVSIQGTSRVENAEIAAAVEVSFTDRIFERWTILSIVILLASPGGPRALLSISICECAVSRAL